MHQISKIIYNKEANNNKERRYLKVRKIILVIMLIKIIHIRNMTQTDKTVRRIIKPNRLLNRLNIQEIQSKYN